ncbi:MAG: hypothetical protein IKW35_07680 [Paludibacteraceae bacterium]|nr:hypothetical protein [Paludibacteraceae bacterium]
MARVVLVECNICYASGKFLHAGQEFDMEDTSLDSKVVAVLEEQMKYGRVVEKVSTPNVFPLSGVNTVSTGGVEAGNDMTAYPTEVQETPAEPAKEEASSEEEVPSADSVIADLAAATERTPRRSIGKK